MVLSHICCDKATSTLIHVLSEIIYQQPNIGSFPLFQHLSLQTGFSWGKNSPNMSYKSGDKQKAKDAHQAFFSKLRLPVKRMLIDPSIMQTEQIIEVDDASFSTVDELITVANVLFCESAEYTLMVHPGDCPCAVFFARKPDGQPLVGLA